MLIYKHYQLYANTYSHMLAVHPQLRVSQRCFRKLWGRFYFCMWTSILIFCFVGDQLKEAGMSKEGSHLNSLTEVSRTSPLRINWIPRDKWPFTIQDKLSTFSKHGWVQGSLLCHWIYEKGSSWTNCTLSPKDKGFRVSESLVHWWHLFFSSHTWSSLSSLLYWVANKN